MIQSQKYTKLSRVCEIFAGHTVRGGLELAAEGGLRVAQLGDVRGGRPVDAGLLGRFAVPGLPDRFIARSGDVLFRSKGSPNNASLVWVGDKEGAAVLQPLMILRPHLEKLLPEYLVWAINRPPAQRHFNASAQGTTIQSVSKSVLEDMPIQVPSLDVQEKIAAIYHLSMREADLLRELAERRELFATLSLENVINEGGTQK